MHGPSIAQQVKLFEELAIVEETLVTESHEQKRTGSEVEIHGLCAVLAELRGQGSTQQRRALDRAHERR